MTNKNTKTVEYVRWLDQFYYKGPITIDEALKTRLEGETVGFLLDENEEMVVLSAERFEEHETFRHVIRIPKVCIVERAQLWNGKN